MVGDEPFSSIHIEFEVICDEGRQRGAFWSKHALHIAYLCIAFVWQERNRRLFTFDPPLDSSQMTC